MAYRLSRSVTAFLLAIATCVAGSGLFGHARTARAFEEPTLLERRVKSAFLYKFAGYVVWPDTLFPRADTPVRIGVVGDDSLAAELERLVAGRTSGGRPVMVARIGGEGDAVLEDMHVLFIGRGSSSTELSQWIERARPRPVLIVTEAPRALALGSIINFVLAEGRVRFEVNLDTAERRGLSLSSRLLTVAMAVVTKAP